MLEITAPKRVLANTRGAAATTCVLRKAGAPSFHMSKWAGQTCLGKDLVTWPQRGWARSSVAGQACAWTREKPVCGRQLEIYRVGPRSHTEMKTGASTQE